jgi:hypothetical protein
MAEDDILNEENEADTELEGVALAEQKAEKVFDKETPGNNVEDQKVSDEDKDDENKDDGEEPAKDVKDDEAPKAPETYEEFSVPEDMDLDEAAVAEFAPVAKELDLTQEQAQKLVDIYAERKLDEARSMHDSFEKVQADWQTEAKADKEYGGADFTANIKKANAFLTEYGSADLNTALAETGMGNHPELIRLFVKAGAAMGDDTLHFGKAAEAAPKDAASILFPNQGK